MLTHSTGAWSYQANGSGGTFFKYGTIGTKGLVLNENGQPIWVEYDQEGKEVREIKAAADPANLKVVSPTTKCA